MIIEEATIEDSVEILALQKAAYATEAEIYNNFSIQPLTESLSEIRDQFNDHIFLKLTDDNNIIGSVRAREKDGTCHIGKLMVHPDHRDKGIGRRLMDEIESRFKHADRYELFTGNKSRKNIALYEKLSYGSFKTKKIDTTLTLVFFEKYTSGHKNRSGRR